MENFFKFVIEVVRIFRPSLKHWIVRSLLVAGIGILTSPFWVTFLAAVLEHEFAIPVSADYVGWGLIALGITMYILGLVDERFSKPSAAEMTNEEARDIKTITLLFSQLSSHSFDRFIELGKTSYVWDPIFHFFSGFEAVLSASNFHVYDEELRTHIQEFFKDWDSSLSYGSHFTQTNNPDVLRLDTVMDLYKSREQEVAHREFTNAIWDAERSFRVLLHYVRTKWPQIDLEETNKIAWKEYVELQERFGAGT